MNDNKLGERIAGLLNDSHMSQHELAEIVHVTDVSMSRYINGDRIPRSSLLVDIANALCTTTDYLVGREEQRDFESEYYKIHRLIARNAPKMSKKQRDEIIEALRECDSD